MEFELVENYELRDVQEDVMDAPRAVDYDETKTQEQGKSLVNEEIIDKTYRNAEGNPKADLIDEYEKTKLEEAHDVNVNVHKPFPKYSTLIDSDSESENAEESDEPIPVQSDKKIDSAKSKKIRIKSEKLKRASAKASEETISIKSGTQRLHRENYVKVPYHKPKRHTLKEFLTRRTLVQPGVIKHSNAKMSKHLLEKYAEHLEARAKEAQDFFKSQSDDENTDKIVPIDTGVRKESNNTEPNNIENEVGILEERTKSSNEVKDNSSAGKEIKLSKDICEMFSEDSASGKLDAADIWEETETNFTKTNFKKLLPLAELPPNPSLKGDSSLLIDLETGKFVSPKLSGVDSLLNTFLKNSGKEKSHMKETSSAKNDIMEFTNTPISNNLKEMKDKPRFSYYKLKNNLKTIITKKRKEELLKKINNEKNEEISDEKNSYDYLDEDGYYENEKDMKNGEHENSEDESSNEADDEYECDEEDIWNHEDLEKGNEGGEKKKTKFRVLTPAEDTHDESENAVKAIDVILGEPLQTENIPPTPLMLRGDKETSDNEAELLELCSGTFDLAGSVQHASTQYAKENPNEAQNTEEVRSSENVNTFDTSDEESCVENSLMKTLNKKRKLGFSEDEEDNEENEGENEEENEEDSEEEMGNEESADHAAISANSDVSEAEEEIVETYIDYDSEENEIEVKLTKDDKSLKIAEFIENEAELSESEWGSEDEDEKDMDKYDVELADEEQFDRAKLQSELEQIHLRRMLDDDKRELKKIQDILFDDEENDGIGRQRQFRWKHAEQNLTLDNRAEDGGYCEDGSGNEDNEQEWREMRHEREILLQNTHSKTDDTRVEEMLAITSSKRISLTKQIDLDSSKGEKSTDPQFLISKASAVRGSFLVRDNKFLKRLANITATIDVDEPVNSVQMKSVKVNKCVFSTYEKTESETKRRHPDSADKVTSYNNKKRKNNYF